MTTIPTNKIKQSLTKKGFIEDNNDHKHYWLYINERKTDVKTKLSHGQKECRSNLLAQMAKQLHLRRKDFDSLIDCTLGKEEYIQMLRTNKII